MPFWKSKEATATARVTPTVTRAKIPPSWSGRRRVPDQDTDDG
jgi:hypothetical protein